ncbi:unnamed protein product [Boreogadus saida]
MLGQHAQRKHSLGHTRLASTGGGVGAVNTTATTSGFVSRYVINLSGSKPSNADQGECPDRALETRSKDGRFPPHSKDPRMSVWNRDEGEGKSFFFSLVFTRNDILGSVVSLVPCSSPRQCHFALSLPGHPLPPLRLLSANQCEWRGPVKHKEVCTAGRRPALNPSSLRLIERLLVVLSEELQRSCGPCENADQTRAEPGNGEERAIHIPLLPPPQEGFSFGFPHISGVSGPRREEETMNIVL